MFKTLRSKKGFVLLYTLLIISVSLVLVFSIVDSALHELRFSGDEFHSISAFYAADSAIECVRYWQDTTALLHDADPILYPYTAFDPRHSPQPYSCGFGVGNTFTVGQSSSDATCAGSGPVTYPTFRLGGFVPGSNAPCADVSVTVSAGTGGACDVAFKASGKNDCRAGAGNVVELSRWENWTQL